MSSLAPSSSSRSTPPSSTQRPLESRHVLFAPNVKLHCGSNYNTPPTAADMKASDDRIAAHDELYRLLHMTCLSAPGRFVPRISEFMSPRRQKLLVHNNSAKFWKELREKQLVNFSTDPSHEINLRIMEKMFLLIWRNAFQRIQMKAVVFSQGETVEQVRNLAQRLIDYFVVFEYDPLGEDHAKFSRDLFHLAFAAYRLRALLLRTDKYKFHFYLPLAIRKGTRKLEFLRNRVSILETHGSTHRASSSDDIIYISLCGGIVKTSLTMEYKSTLECRAVGVAWRPAEGERPLRWSSLLTDEEIEEVARQEALEMEREANADD